MDELEKLFNVLSRNGYYTKSFEEFQAKYNDPAYRDKVFSVVTRDGLFTKTREEFDAKYAPSGVETVDVETEVQEGPLKKKEGTVSPSGLGSLGLPSVTDIIEGKAAGPQETVEVETEVEVEAPQVVDKEVSDFFDVSQPFAPKPEQMVFPNMVSVRQYDDFDIRGVNRGPMIQVDLNDPDLETRKKNQRLYINQLEAEAKSELNKIVLDKDVTEKTSEIEKELIQKKKELEKTNYLSAGADGKPIEVTTFEEVLSGVKPTEGLEVDLSLIGTEPKVAKVLYDNEVKRYEDNLKKEAGFVKVNGEYYDPNMLPPDVGFDATVRRTDFRNIIDNEEEFSVPTMRLRFSPYGFQFEETGVGDAMKVTSPNKEVQEFNLDPSFGEAAEGIRLKKFLVKEYNKYADTLSEKEFVEQALKGMPLEYQSTDDAKTQALRQKKYIRDVSNKMERDGEDVKSLEDYMEKEYAEIESLEKLLATFTEGSEMYNNTRKAIDERLERYNKILFPALEAKHKQLILQNDKLKRTVGYDIINDRFSKDNDYSSMREDMGDISSIPATVLSEFGYGINDVLSGTTSLGHDLYANINNIFYDESDEGYVTDAERKEFKKLNLPMIRKGFGGAIAEGANLTEEYVQKAKESGGIITEGLFGLVRSMPAMMTGSASLFSFMAMGTDMINQEMEKNPDFDNISENEKLLLTVPVGIVIGTLERFGFRNALNNSSLIGRLTLGGLKKLGLSSGKQIAKEGTKRTFTEIVEREIKNKLVRGGTLALSSAAAEFETGAAQEIAEVFGKEIYDLAKDQDYFKQSISILKDDKGERNLMSYQFLKEVVHAGAAEAVGGFTMGMPRAFTAANRDNRIAEISPAAYDLFRMYRSNPELLKIQKKNLNARAADPKDSMTQEEADKIMLDYEYMIGQASEINPEFDSQAQRQILALMMQQRDIKDAMQNKDKRTTKELQRQSEIIDEDITAISAEAHKRANVQRGEYEAAVKEGYKGTFDDYRTGKNIKEAIKEQAAKEKGETEQVATTEEEVAEAAEEVTPEVSEQIEQTQEESKPVAETVVEEEVTTEEAPVTEEEQEPKTETAGMRLFKNEEKLRRDKELRIKEAEQRAEKIKKIKELEKSKRKGPRKILKAKVPEVTQEQEDSYNNNEMSQEEIKDILRGVYAKRQTRSDEAFAKVKEKDMSPELTAFERKVLKENSELYSDIVATEPISTLFDRFTGKPKAKTEAPKKEAPKKEVKAETPKKETGIDAKLRAIAVKMDKAVKEKVSSNLTKAERELIKKNTKRFKEINDEVKMPTTTADGIRSAINMIEDSFKEKEAKLKEQIKTIDDRVTDRMTKDKERQKKKDELSKARKEKNAKVKELKAKLTDMGAQFQLEAEATSEKTKAKLLKEANKLLDDVIQENNGEISEDPFTAENPAPGAEIITIEVKENSKLIEGLERMGLKDLVGKKISLVMADQLKVDKKRMGGPFFPLIPKLRGKVAWASIDKKAASGIINGAIKSDYSVVYNMSPSAIDSNSIMGETLIDLLNALPKSEKQEVFELMKENVLKSKAKGFVRIKKVFENSKTLSQAMKGLQKLGVDERAALLKKVVPSRDVKAGTGIGVKLQENNITIEGLREMNAEQFVADLPAGAMTMVLEVTDKAGNKVTKKTKDEALITPEQQKEEGLPEHPNYPVYIRGRAVGLLTETTPFFNVLKDVARNLEVKLAGLVKKKSGRKITSKEARSNEMRSASMKASKSRTVQSPTASSYEKFIAVLKRSFPSVEVLTSQEEFDALLKETGTKKLTKKNQKVYGAVYQGKLYLNPSLENFNTPIHEFGHIWMNVAKESAPEIYKKGMDLIKGTDYESQVRNNPAYQKVIKQMAKDGATEQEINDYVQEEALATAIGDKGESFVKAAQKKNFKEWLNTLYGFVKKLTGISKLSAAQLENISLNEFLQAVSVDLLSGEQLFEGAEVKEMGDALQLQIIGENAQLSQEVKENLSVAKAMEKNNMSPKEIRLATSWQKGTDGKWRYEIGDIEAKVKISNSLFNYFSKIIKRARGLKTNEALLSDFLNYPELFNSYPQLKNIKVILDDKISSTLGSFNPKTNTITLNTSERSLDSLEIKGTLLHEVQHAIQKIEGFASGGSIALAENIILPKALKDKQERLDKLFEKFNAITKSVDEKLKKIEGYDFNIYKRLNEKYSNIIEQEYAKGNYKFNPHTKEEQKILDDNAKLSESIYAENRKRTAPLTKEIVKLQKEIQEGKKNFLNSMSEEQRSNLTEQTYRALAGEVEARNVEERMGMTRQERREKSLQETEDVAREQQVVLFGGTSAMASEGIDLKGDMQTVINKAREDGFKDSEIKGVLKAIGYKARNINEALKVEIETDVTMPSIFGDIEGGAVKGQEMFTRLREKVAKFAKNNSPAKTREKAMELLREDPTYKEQSEKTKLELIKEFDKTLKSKANAKVRQEIAGIKQRIKDVTTGEVSIKDARTRLKNLIKDTLPKSREYSQADINRLNRIVDKATPETYQAAVTAVLEEVNKFRGKQRESKLKKILKDIQAKAKQSRKSGARIAAEDQPFFKQAAVLVKAAIDGDAEVFAELADEMTDKEAEIFELFEKINNNEELTTKERELVAKAQAFDMLGKINNQELEALDDVIADVKAETKASRERLKGKRLARKEIYDSLREQANKDISEGYPYLFDEVVNEDGSTSLVPLNDAQLRARRQEIRKNLLKDGKLVKNVREYFNLMYATEGKLVKGFFANYLKHLGTLTNGLDRKGNFFTENIYKRLNRMEENNLKGYFSTTDAIDNNINTIDGIDNGLDGLYTTLNNSLSALNEDKIELKNVRLGSTNVVEKKVSLNKDEAARIIAISRNEQQRDRLEKQGIGEAEIKKLEEFIGEPAVKAVDKIVDYLSSTYYESINKVYEDVNDVSLNYVENYFPVKTITEKTDKKRNAELATSLQEGKFSKVFSAQQASSLKERSESKNPIAITGFSFTQELDTHITEMERFKAYAQGTKELNVIMNHTPSVKKLLDATNLDRVMSRGVGYAINPNAMQDLFRLNNPYFSALQERFTGVALALKFIQLPKQASSFVNAFADYQLRDKGRIPILDTAADLIAFTLESAYVGFIKPRSTFKQAMDVSASFRNRMRQSFKTADLSGLETGQRATYGSGRTRRTKFARARRKAKIIANSPTLVGDAAGVMGYMVAYRNNIRKGMSPEEALERFNDYNATQQTRRATEKIGLQYDSNMIIRSFTMFGSTLFLQLNKVMQSATNIRRGTANAVTEGNLKEMPSTKDYRELFLNLGAANLLFTMTANIFKYNPFAATGDDDDEITDEDIDRVNKAKNALKRGKKISAEDQDLIDRYQFKLDKEQVLEQYFEAISGLNLLYNLPLVGGDTQTLMDTYWWGYSDAMRKPRSRVTNPISQISRQIYYDTEIGGKSTTEAVITRLFEYGLGVPSKAPLAAIDKLRSWFNSNDDYLLKEYEKKDEDGKRIAKEESFEKFKENRFEENMYDLLGISYSYRPGSAKSKDIIYVPIEVNKKSKDDDDSSSKPSKPQRPQRPQRPRRN